MKTLVILSFILAVGAYASAQRTGACWENYEETTANICEGLDANNAPVSSNFSTIDDVLWLFTPKKFYLSYADKFQYARVYEAGNGICSASEADLASMDFKVNFTLFDMALSFKNERTLHMTCTPLKALASSLFTNLFKALKGLTGDLLKSQIQSLMSLAQMDPKDFAKFKCEPLDLPIGLPSLQNAEKPEMLKNCLVSISWTDHPANNVNGGTGMLMSKCLNGRPLWGVVSTTEKQPQQNINDFTQIINSQNFNPLYYSNQEFAN